MSILSGYGKFKRYVLTDTGYKLCSQWTSSNTVHFDDNKTAQTKLGAIDGITDSLTSTSSKIALSAKSGKSLQDQITSLNTDFTNNRISSAKYGFVSGITLTALDWTHFAISHTLGSTPAFILLTPLIANNVRMSWKILSSDDKTINIDIYSWESTSCNVAFYYLVTK